MTITIHLPAATEEKLRAQATSTGKKVEVLVVEAVEEKLTLAHLSLREILAPVHEDFHKSGMTEGELENLVQETIAENRAARKPKRVPERRRR